MFEALKNYQVLLLVIVTVIFIIGFVFMAVKYFKTRKLEEIRADVYKLFIKAEHAWNESGQGVARMKWVVQKARSLLPKWLGLIITEDMLRKIIQFWFDGIKDLLDDGKLNKSNNDVEE